MEYSRQRNNTCKVHEMGKTVVCEELKEDQARGGGAEEESGEGGRVLFRSTLQAMTWILDLSKSDGKMVKSEISSSNRTFCVASNRNHSSLLPSHPVP